MLLSIIVFVLSNTIYLSLLQNRLYFVFVARQLNAIRKHFLESPSSGFKNNQLYTSTNFSAFKLNSLHSLQMFGVSFISSLFMGTFAFSFLGYIKQISLLASVLVFIVTLILQTVYGFKYLKDKSKLSADMAIHK